VSRECVMFLSCVRFCRCLLPILLLFKTQCCGIQDSMLQGRRRSRTDGCVYVLEDCGVYVWEGSGTGGENSFN